MNIGIVIQARTSSNRLPNKVFLDLNGKYAIQRILSGCKKTIYPNKIILAMPAEDRDVIESRINGGELRDCTDERFELFIGECNLNNLIDRYYGVCRKHKLDVIIRLTADCPMHEAFYFGIDEMVEEYIEDGCKGFMGNNLLTSPNPYPCGIDVEIFNYEMMCWAKRNAKSDYELEHCVPIFYSKVGADRFGLKPFNNSRPHTMVSKRISDFSLDTQADYELLLKLTEAYDRLGDLNKAIENVDLGEFKKTNFSKNFK